MEIVIVLVILGVIALGVAGYFQSQKRKKALADWATAQGFIFHDAKDHDLEDRFCGFSCLREGTERYAYNIIEGRRNDRGLCAFDYHYATHSTDSKGNRQTHHHYFSAVVLQADLPLRPLLVRAEHFFDKVTEFFGYDDIDFESAEFSRAFYVKAPNKRWAYDVLHQATMEFLLSAPRFTLEIQGGCVMAYRDGTFSVREFAAAVGLAEGVLDRLPPSVLRELKGVS